MVISEDEDDDELYVLLCLSDEIYIAKFPNELIKVFVFLNEKAATGEFK